MDTNLTLTQKELQRLSTNQIQSLNILALSTESLYNLLQKESEENPFMEYSPNQRSSSNNDTSFLDFIAAPEEQSIRQFILEQVNPTNFTAPQWALFCYLADYVDNRGYLTITEDELTQKLPLPAGLFEFCLHRLQSLDPAGIGAVSLKDCLKLQLKRIHKLTPLSEDLIDHHLAAIGKQKMPQIYQSVKGSKSEIDAAISLIKKLNPAPLSPFFETETSYIIPDVIIQFTNNGHEVILNDSWSASYSMSDYYVRMMKTTTDESVKEYFQTKYTRCRFLFYNIERRRKTLHALTDAIWSCQHDYLQNQGPLQPMTLTDIAKKVGLHPSTISRSIKDKYLQTPHKTMSFKQLFQRPFPKTKTTISKDAVKQALAHLIENEDVHHPYSDDQLTDLLTNQFGHAFSRRLIQKYRGMMHISNSYSRHQQ